MRVVAFVITQGEMPAETIAEMNSAWPAYEQELEQRGGFMVGRELDLPDGHAATVRVRDGERLVSDGPFAETKEFLAGLELFDAANLDDAIDRETRNPVLRFNPFELRPVPETFRVGAAVGAFKEMDDAAGVPYLMTVWADRESDASSPSHAGASDECAAWRARLEAEGRFILGGAIGGRDTAVTLRTHEQALERHPGSFHDLPESIVAIEVVRATDLTAATELAASHPLAGEHAIELRSFYTGEMPEP